MERVSDALLAYVKERISHIDKIKAEKVIIGVGYTAVKLDTGHVGLCHTLQTETPIVCCEVVKKAGTLAGRPALELAAFLKSWDLGERVVGVATINALAELEIQNKVDRYRVFEGNLIDCIKINPADTVAVVGNIRPIIPELKKRAKKVIIFERGGLMDEGVLPDTACEELLPKADVAIITGTTLANGTIDRILELSSSARERALIGPSASTIPDPLFKRRVSAIAGTQTVDGERVLRIVAEGGGTPQLKGAVKFIVVMPKR